jgi:CheY-like chemotaxis protein
MVSPKKILLVDDDEASIYITQRILNKAEIEAEVLLAKHGQEALEIVKEVCQQEQCPELILLDINMPVMDGFEFLEELQKSTDLSSAPIKIVLLSSSTHELDLAKAKKYPVIDYIEKPLSPEKLVRFL